MHGMYAIDTSDLTCLQRGTVDFREGAPPKLFVEDQLGGADVCDLASAATGEGGRRK